VPEIIFVFVSDVAEDYYTTAIIFGFYLTRRFFWKSLEFRLGLLKVKVYKEESSGTELV